MLQFGKGCSKVQKGEDKLLLVLKELWALLANVMAYEEAGVCV